MSRSNLPQSGADRIAAAATAVAIAAAVWVILAFAPDTRDVSFSSALASSTRHVDEGSRAAAPPASKYRSVQVEAPQRAADGAGRF